MRAEPLSPATRGPTLQLHDGAWPDGIETLSEVPQASFFHGAVWGRAVQRALPRHAPFVLAMRAADGALQGACAFAAVRRCGVLRLYAGPLGTYGGIVATTAAAEAGLADALAALPRRRRLALVRVHDFAGGTAARLGALPRWHTAPESCQVLDLPGDPQELFQHAFTAQNRNKIRKAERAGLTVRRSADAAALTAYAALYRAALPRWQVRRALPAALFAALAGGAGVDVWLAERTGEPVAALLNLRGGGQIMNWGNVSRPEAWHDAPNNLLHWRAIEAACRDASGPRLYNFGSSAGLPGVQAFKAAFGTRVHSYRRLEYRAAWLGPATALRGLGRRRRT